MTNEMIRNFAQSFLALSFWDEWDNLKDSEDGFLITESEHAAIKQKYHRRQDISDTIAPMFAHFGLNLDEFIPLQFVEETINMIDAQWDWTTGKFSVAQLYERSPYAAWGCIASQTGMGVSATDDPNIKELFDSLGISEPSQYREIPSAWDAVVAMQQAILKKRTEAIFFDEAIGTRLCQWHDGMDAIYAVGSSAIALHPVPPNVVRDAVSLLERNLAQVRTNSPHDENIEELMDLIEELMSVLPDNEEN